MEDQELLEQISYRKGYILTMPDNARDRPQRYEVMVIRYDAAASELLVRSDVGSPALRYGMEVLIEAWGTDALYRFEGIIQTLVPTKHDQFVIALHVDDVDPIQRRSLSRYETRYPTTFFPARRQTVDLDPWSDGHEVGHATNIGLGGMQLETDQNLPEECVVYCNISAPGGRLHIEGKIVSKRSQQLGGFVYGIEFLRYDNLTSHRLNSLVLRIERENTRPVHTTSRRRVPAQRTVRRQLRRKRAYRWKQ